MGMKPAALFLMTTLASCENERTTCANADYAECGAPLPARQLDGRPWPTFSEALAAALLCPNDVGPEADVVLRGECADGRQFITRNQVRPVTAGAYAEVAGTTHYFANGMLVGIFHFDRDGGGPCQCPENGFTGPAQAVHCEGAMFEPLCGSAIPRGWRGSFTEQVAGCSCDPSPWD
jgi:hypothetical protein